MSDNKRANPATTPAPAEPPKPNDIKANKRQNPGNSAAASNIPKPSDAKATFENNLIQRSTAPFKKVLDEEEKEGMALFMNLFVKTHPVMQRMVERRVKEATGAAGRKAAAAPQTGVTPQQGAGPPENAAAEAPRDESALVSNRAAPPNQAESGVVAKGGKSGVVPKRSARGAKGKVGGRR